MTPGEKGQLKNKTRYKKQNSGNPRCQKPEGHLRKGMLEIIAAAGSGSKNGGIGIKTNMASEDPGGKDCRHSHGGICSHYQRQGYYYGQRNYIHSPVCAGNEFCNG